MINYDKYNYALLHTRDAQLMVCYKDGSLTEEELLRRGKHLKAYHFIPDSLDLTMTMCGMQLGGIIIEEDAELSYRNFRYAMTRLRSEDPQFILMMNDKHKERFWDIMEEFYESSNDKEHLKKSEDRIVFVNSTDMP